MLLKKGFQFSSDDSQMDVSPNDFLNDRIEISLTRDEYNALCICLSRLVVVEPKYNFYREYSRSLVREFYTFD